MRFERLPGTFGQPENILPLRGLCENRCLTAALAGWKTVSTGMICEVPSS